MRFSKLLLRGVPEKGDTTVWRLIIDNEDDLAIHHKGEAYRFGNALLGLARSDNDGSLQTTHLFGADVRQQALGTLLRIKQETMPKGEVCYPLIETAKIVDSKYLSQLRHINEVGAIQISEGGGWCGLDSFLRTWNGEVIETIYKDTEGFPTDDEDILADTICLENGPSEFGIGGQQWLAQAEFGEDAGIIQVINNLKEKDIDFVIRSLSKTKNIYASTQLKDEAQFNGFMQIFSKMPRKNITIKVINNSIIEKIKKHPLYDEVSKIHNVKIKVW